MDHVLEMNDMVGCDYVEPFAGGAGIALSLLLRGRIGKIYLNDFDRSIYAFWRCVLQRTDMLCRRVSGAKLSVEEWRKQRALQDKPGVSLDDLGFSTLYLNRVNYSGIIRGGLIGGVDQAGENAMGCRFKKAILIHKIMSIAAKADRIKLFRRDGLNFISQTLSVQIPEDALVYMDPPYYCSGQHLYLSAFGPSKHRRLKKLLAGILQRWVMTYDCTFEINRIHADRRRRPFRLNYSANRKSKQVEILLWDDRLKIPKSM